MDRQTLDRYITLTARRGQHKNMFQMKHQSDLLHNECKLTAGTRQMCIPAEIWLCGAN